jgi:hypothetical protein
MSGDLAKALGERTEEVRKLKEGLKNERVAGKRGEWLSWLVLGSMLLFGVIFIPFPRHHGPPYTNERSLMRGARCSLPVYEGPLKESTFGEVDTVGVWKMTDKGYWVVSFADTKGCMLSFWTSGGGEETSVKVLDISSY